MKKNLLTWMMFAAAAIGMYAEDNHLYIKPTTGEIVSWSVPSLQKITFENGNIVLTKKDGMVSYTPISDVGRMYVSTPSAEKIETVGKELAYSWDGKRLQLNAQAGTLITVYSVTGAVVIRESLSYNSIDFSNLGKGLYIVNVDGQTFKIIKK